MIYEPKCLVIFFSLGKELSNSFACGWDFVALNEDVWERWNGMVFS